MIKRKESALWLAALIASFAYFCYVSMASAQVGVLSGPNSSSTYNITNGADNLTLEENVGTIRIKPAYQDSIRTGYRGITSWGVARDNYSSFANFFSALNGGQEKTGHLKAGEEILTSTVYPTTAIRLEGVGSASPKDDDFWNNGSILKFQGLTYGVWDSTQGRVTRGVTFVGDSTTTTQTGLRVYRPKQTTTLGYYLIENNIFRNFAGTGVEITGPDNGSVFSRNQVNYNGSHGLFADKTTGNKGLNLNILYNRFLANDSSQLRINSVDYIRVVGNGILGAGLHDEAALKITGTKGRIQGGFYASNDIEPDVQPGTRSACVDLNSVKNNVFITNRFGAANRGITINGAAVSETFIGNNFVNVDSPLVVYSGRFNALLINNENVKAKNAVLEGGTYRYMEIVTDDDGTRIDAGGNASTNGLKLNPFAQSDIILFDSSATDVSQSLLFYGNKDDSLRKVDMFYDVDHFVINPDTGTIRIGRALELASLDTVLYENESNPHIYKTAQKTVSGAWPFNTSGNLIIQGRSTSDRDIVFVTGSTPNPGVIVSRHGNLGIGVDHGTSDRFGNGTGGVLTLINATVPPTAVVTDGITLYAKDVAGSSELAARDEAGNEVILTDLTSSGEANTNASRAGAGVEINDGKTGSTNYLKKLKAGEGLTVTDGGDSITYALKALDFFHSSDDRTYGASDNFNIWYVSNPITISRVVGYTDVGTYTINVYWRSEASPTSGGTAILSSSLVLDTNSEASTTFADATIPANSWIAIQSSAITSTPTEVGVAIKYTVD